MPTRSRTAGAVRLRASQTAASRAAAAVLAVPDHLASTLRPLAPGAAWLHLRAAAPDGQGRVTAFRADGTVVPLSEQANEAILRWIAADHPSAPWETELGLDLTTGLLCAWINTPLGDATSVGI